MLSVCKALLLSLALQPRASVATGATAHKTFLTALLILKCNELFRDVSRLKQNAYSTVKFRHFTSREI
jgi:hypothetical protein